MGYQLGKKVVDDGIWKEFSGAELKIMRAGTVEYLKVQENLEKPYRKKIDRGTLGAKLKRDLNLLAIATAILVDWKGVQDEKKKAVAYTVELGMQALKDDPDLLEFVMEVALDTDNFSVERVNEVAKKSSAQ